MYSWIFGRRRSNAYISESLVTEANKMVFGHRFKHIKHLHKDSTDLGLNTIALPNQGLDTVGIHRSSLPCTPAATPSWEYSLTQARQFTEETFRDRLLVPRKGKRRAHVIPNKAAEFKEDEADGARPPIYPGHPMLGGMSNAKKEDPIERKVFVGNISYRVTQKQLREFFSKFGKVIDCHIVYDHYKRKSKGIGFVTFQSTQSASQAKRASFEDLIFDQREMRVLACESKKRLDRSGMHRSKDREGSSEDEYELRHQSSTESAKSNTIMEEGFFNINELNDDILIYVFSMLPIDDRVRMERVCRRWRVLSINSWKHSSVLKFPNLDSFYTKPLTNRVFRSILQRCHHIKKLDMSSACHSLDHRALSAIANHCPYLNSINLSGVPASNVHLQQLASKCLNLKEVYLAKNYDVGEKGLWSLFNQCKQLVLIDITDNSRITGKCFHMLGPKLKEAILDSCLRIQPISFSKLALRCPKLRHLSLNNCRLLNDRCIKDICCNLRRLRVLHINGRFPDLTCGGLVWLGELIQLEELTMAQNSLIDDLVLQAICEGCLNLKTVDISSCSEVTDLGLRALAQLTYLNNLNISYLSDITDQGVEEISKRGMLEVLITRGCITLTDHVFITTAALCIDLKKLDLSGCDNVTNATLNGCLDGLSMRDNNIKLKVIIGGTSCMVGTDEFQNENLEISWANLCLKYLRPDRADFIELEQSDGNSELSLGASGGTDRDAEINDFLENDDPSLQYDNEMGDSPF